MEVEGGRRVDRHRGLVRDHGCERRREGLSDENLAPKGIDGQVDAGHRTDLP